jgi:hypothetical protein
MASCDSWLKKTAAGTQCTDLLIISLPISACIRTQCRVYLLREGETVTEFLCEMWAFMKERKKFWLFPIVIMLTLLGGLIVLTQGSVVAPFIYTLF